ARGQLDQGMEVTELHLAQGSMEMQLVRKAGNLLKAALEKRGMTYEMQTNTTEILGEEGVEGDKLADGREIPAALVVKAVGI
ncbi:FAD-dependent oxidoreductase, partial [Staphylococcus aureus]